MTTGGFRDYFKTLGVERTANDASIKRAFRKLARKYHPDLNPNDSNAEAKFKEINEAYEVLSDPTKRSKYEHFGKYWNHSGDFQKTEVDPVSNDIDFGEYRNFDEFINDLLGRFTVDNIDDYRTGVGFPSYDSRNELNLDAEVSVEISFNEAFHGTERILSINDERVKVRIPKGVRTGSRLRLKQKGNIQPGTGRRGDLFLVLEVEKHLIWNLDGNQLKADLPVSIEELVLGGKIKVVLPDGEAHLNIPKASLPGNYMRLKGKGWPEGEVRGDLIFRLILEFPDEWSLEELEVFKNLKQLRKIDPRKNWIESAVL